MINVKDENFKLQAWAKRIPLQDIIQYYEIENHTQQETCKHFDIGTECFFKLLHYYGYKKPMSKQAEIAKKVKLQKYGDENYNNKEKRKNTCLEKYGTPTAIQNSEIKEKAIKNRIASFNKLYGVDNYYQAVNSKRAPRSIDSKPNQKFASFLQSNNVLFIKEFNIDGKWYDFKINNMLIEINPSFTHNSTFSFYDKSKRGLDPLYHYNKTKTALDHGYKCLCLWDWTDPNKIIELLQKDFTQIQSTPRRHLFNINTKEHIILQDEPFTPGDGWVEIYDDGSEIS